MTTMKSAPSGPTGPTGSTEPTGDPHRAAGASGWRRLPGPLGVPRSVRDTPFAALRLRLVVTNVVVVAVVLAALCAIFYTYEAHSTQVQVDQQLADEARHEAMKGLPNATTTDATESPYIPGSPNLFAVVIAAPHQVAQDDDQVAQYGLPDWASAQPVLVGTQATTAVTVVRGGVRYRLYTLPIHSGTRVVGAVQSGTSLTVYDERLHDLLVILVLLSVCVLLLTAILSAYLTERSLTPARQAFARQRQFAAAASHELRTPLAFIRSQAELIAGTDAAGTDGEDVTGDARDIITEVDYLTRMTHDLLLLARDEGDVRALNRTFVDLRAVMRDAAATALPLAGERGVRLIVADNTPASGKALSVLGDADRLRQLVLILLDNSIRYTPSGGAVYVDARAERRARLGSQHRRCAVLTVRDTGVGIAPEVQPHIFEPFYRSNAAQPHARDEGSTGLGLALAQWIAHAHGGAIAVRSTPGEGSVFTITLPRMLVGAAGAGSGAARESVPDGE